MVINRTDKIYIAGHTGMVGSALVRKFEGSGYSNLCLRTHQELDLLDQKAVFALLQSEKPDVVIVTAAKVGGILANNTYRAQFIYENLVIESNLIHGAHLASVNNLLFMGSSCIYPRGCPQPMKEEYLLTGPLEQTNEPYAIAKIAGIKLCENYYRQYGRNYFSVMPTNLYGPHDNYNLETSHVLPALLRKIQLAKWAEVKDFESIGRDLSTSPSSNQTAYDPYWSDEDILDVLEKYGVQVKRRNSSEPMAVKVKLWGTGAPRREFLHVDDLADAVLFLLQNIQAGEIYNRGISHLNIGTGRDITIKELAEMIGKIIGFEGKIVWDSHKPDGTPQKLLDVSRLVNYGWQSRITLRSGLEKTMRK